MLSACLARECDTLGVLDSMSPQSLPALPGRLRFAAFEVDPHKGVLRKHGIRIRLQDQPFRVLLALLERPGEVVTREQLRNTIWAGTEFGDFDHSLNITVNKIRDALGDSPANPRYVETVVPSLSLMHGPVWDPSSWHEPG